MSTPPMSTKPGQQSGTERRFEQDPGRTQDPSAEGKLPEASSGERSAEQREPSQQAYPPPQSDRAVDADLLLDIPQLSVEQLSLGIDASLLLNSVKIDAKGLDAGLFLKANLDLLRILVERTTGDGESSGSRASYAPAGAETSRVPAALREMLQTTRDAYRDLSDRNVQKRLRDVHTSAREAYDQMTSDESQRGSQSGGESQSGDESQSGGGNGRSRATLQRGRHAAIEGAKAAGLAVAGLAGGAILESRTKTSRKLPLPRRRNRAQAIGHEIAKRLPMG